MTQLKKRRGQGHACPHCLEAAIIYASRTLSVLVTEKWLQCTNLECGHRYVIQEGVVRTTVPSLMPKADVSIPMVAQRANDILVTRGGTSSQPNVRAAFPPTPQDAAGHWPTRTSN